LTRRAAAVGGAIVVAALAVAVVAVVAGRWEGRRAAAEQNRGMRRTLAAVGALDSRTLSGYRLLPAFDCLVYRRGANPLALEVCVDRSGRVVETIDRRSGHRISSLRFDPAASAVRVDRAEVDRLLRKMGAHA
jgi:hypothetical protein